jgi:hypothetical protein
VWFPQLIFLLVLYTFGPGLLLVRPLRLAPGERLIAAVGSGCSSTSCSGSASTRPG